MPERARARRADWAPGPGVLVPLPEVRQHLFYSKDIMVKITSGSTDLDVEGVDAKLLAADGDILSSQHGSVRRGLITISLDLHATSDTGDGLATTVIQVSPNSFDQIRPEFNSMDSPRVYEPEIGDVHEGIVERSEDTSNAEDELTWGSLVGVSRQH